MNLIANSGLQILSYPFTINMDDNFKMSFYEWFDTDEGQLKLELAHFFSEDEIWVKKLEIHNLLGLGLSDGKVGREINGRFVNYTWEDIKDDFISEGHSKIEPLISENGDSNCYHINTNRCKWEKFENKWLPFPYFSLGFKGKTEFGPTNWCRCKLVPQESEGNTKKYILILAFDTATKYENESFEEQDLMESPVFASSFDKSKDFAPCNNEFALINFCSKMPYECDWIDDYILELFHGVKNLNELLIKLPKMNYLAQFIFLINYIQHLKVLPNFTLFSDKNVVFGDVDLVVDMGNSRTCAVLFDDHDFTRVESLKLFNFTNPIKNGKLNLNSNSFDMRLAFRDVDFGINTLIGSKQFVYPSLVRLGEEASHLMHNAINLNTGLEKITTFSSPKRYLWDNKKQTNEWEFLTLEGEASKSRLLHIKGISEQLNSDGTLNLEGEGGIIKNYSRKALMTFAFVEILSQAQIQINSFEYRHKWGKENTPRKIGKIIITCPTAMSKNEQIALRKSAEDAAIILKRYYDNSVYKIINEKDLLNSIQVIPSSNNLSNMEDTKEWIYDEATCAQFVFLYAEVTNRYKNNALEYFNFYGKQRNDLKNYNKKSITIGSVDIGAGTTDLMIAAYKYDDSGQCTLTPVPLFWESFYYAGDDLLNKLIRLLIIEGKHALIPNHLKKIGKQDYIGKIIDFFGKDNSRLSVTDRQIRSEFNLQVSMPIVTYFLEMLKENKISSANLRFSDVFSQQLPSNRIIELFNKHFKFSLEDLEIEYNKSVISEIVEGAFDTLIGKISTILSYYGCDIVLLTGRPTSLKPIYDLFYKYYSVSPNRLITLNDYRIGSWYPFQDGKGYFSNTKSIVAIGAMIGNYASTRGSLNGFSLDLNELKNSLKPTTEFFSKGEEGISIIGPDKNKTILEIAQLPIRLWTRQLDSVKYPTRPFYSLDFNEEKIKEKVISKFDLNLNDTNAIKDYKNNEIERIKKMAPLKFNIVREEYSANKELLKIESVVDKENNELPISYFNLQVQSMIEGESYWLDTGAFDNLNINQI